ncbi:MAG: hypothetical protein K5890_06705 [Bacteroidales bacterium]|nr:hypothetical protein [Bacteroidales bacterium]
MMKKQVLHTVVWLFITIVLINTAFSQSVTLKFTGRDASNHPVQLYRIVITNMTKGWQETIYWPDTILILQNGTGIDDLATETGFLLSQNTPNPFNGQTEVTLFTDNKGETTINIYDLNGSLIASKRQQIEKGYHRFKILLETAQSYLLIASCNGHQSSIKMVNNGGGSSNNIKYLGTSDETSFSKGSSNKPFNFGDYMGYVGYSYNTQQESSNIIQAQNSSETITLHFSTTSTTPTVTTTAITNFNSYSAVCGGNVTSDGGTPVTARGVCWSTSQNPTTSDNHTTDGSGTGVFTSNITGLTTGTTYYVRAYATNGAGTVYGNAVSFTTLNYSTAQDGQPCPNAATVMDYDGNIYNTVQIGDQCWMKENLRTTHFSNGISIALGTASSTITAYRYLPNDDYNNINLYGYLYNWSAVMKNAESSSTIPSGVQGVCPNGWHVPSYSEWIQLTNYVSSQSQYFCEGNNNYIAKALANQTGWDISSGNWNWNCYIGNNPSSNNATGFSVIPAGVHFGYGYGGGTTAYFWSSTQFGDGAAGRFMDISHATMQHSANSKDYGCSVRCLRDDNSLAMLPTVTTNILTSITTTTASCGGNVTLDGGSAVIERGVCWASSPSPTINDNRTNDGTGLGSFTSFLTGLTAGTVYYMRAYATNNVGTTYGGEIAFTTISSSAQQDGQPCPNVAMVTDYDNNIYNTVQIGAQCWMKENLRTTHYSNGISIALGTTSSTTTAYRYFPNDNSSNVATHGYLYNWPAVMNGESSSTTNPSGVHGICPIGWHMPSDSEWTQLTNYVSSQGQYVCGSNNTSIAKALANQTGWDISTTTCCIGNSPSTNNSTGFSAIPAGERLFYNNTYDNFGMVVRYWSTTEYYSNRAYHRTLSHNSSGVGNSFSDKNYAFSVRCLSNTSSSITLPSITTTVSNLTNTSATCIGNVTSDGGSTVIARGMCWSTFENPTISDSITTEGVGTGNFTSFLLGLTAGTTYYVRAYATNSAGTSYGNEISFTTLYSNTFQDGQPCPNIAMVTDYDNNHYYTVQIGNQCWMKENLRTTHYADGSNITLGTTISSTTAYRYYPNNNNSSSNLSTYGYLYNYKAVMRNFSSSNANPSGVQGICPTGWHVPSDAEWMQLINYLSCQSQHFCDNNSSFTAKSLAAQYGWNTSGATCVIGNSLNTNNSTGFGALPAGNYSSSYNYFGNQAFYYSCTQSHHVFFSYDNATVGRSTSSAVPPGYGFSVRCICNDIPTATLPTVTTNNITNTSYSTAICGGNVTSDGGATVTARGVCWSTSQNPTTSSNHTVDGSGTGAFTSNITGLTPGTTYYLRAYATNSAGTAYGTQRSFTTTNSVQVPAVITNVVSNITTSSATCGGNVTSDGGATVTARGVCWSTSQNPTVSSSHTVDGSGTGAYTSNLTGLESGTTYYVRAYATNSVGTVYGNAVSFTTLNSSTTQDGQPCPNSATVTDYDGNVYNTVKIGNQCWMKENLRTTKYSDGTDIVLSSNANIFYPNNNPAYVIDYGHLYNWFAVMHNASSSYTNPSGVQGICPTGWHLPSDAEWTQLTDYVSGHSEFICGSDNTYIAKALAYTQGWSSSTGSCEVGNNQNSNNGTGFSARPAGCSNGVVYTFGLDAEFWSATQPYYRSITYHNATVQRETSSTLNIGLSVRCIRDDSSTSTLPSVTTSITTNITSTSVTCGGNVSSDGGAIVTARGVCWSTTQNPTVSSSHTVDGSGTGAYTSNLTGLESGTTYYVRAYATNSVGTAYGAQKSFTTTNSVQVPSVTTNVVSNITTSSATCGGNVTSDGGATVTARGACWSTSQNPTVSSSYTIDGSGTGTFISNISGLTSGTTYYVRAYATNSAGTAYGNAVSFTTLNSSTTQDGQPCPNAITVTDYDGNVYNTVKIGNQCWMKENLQTSHYANGTSIALGTTASNTIAYRYYPNNDINNVVAYGYLYNWPAVMNESSSSNANPSGVQGICPNGWHVPSDAEWTQLTNYISSQSQYICGGNSTSIGKSIANQTGWNTSNSTCAIGNTPNTNNATGFSALPCGTYVNGNHLYFGNSCDWWSTTVENNDKAYNRYLDYFAPNVKRDGNMKSFGNAVRCIRD